MKQNGKSTKKRNGNNSKKEKSSTVGNWWKRRKKTVEPNQLRIWKWVFNESEKITDSIFIWNFFSFFGVCVCAFKTLDKTLSHRRMPLFIRQKRSTTWSWSFALSFFCFFFFHLSKRKIIIWLLSLEYINLINIDIHGWACVRWY